MIKFSRLKTITLIGAIAVGGAIWAFASAQETIAGMPSLVDAADNEVLGTMARDDLQVEDYIADTLRLTDMRHAHFNQDRFFLHGHSYMFEETDEWAAALIDIKESVLVQ